MPVSCDFTCFSDKRERSPTLWVRDLEKYKEHWKPSTCVNKEVSKDNIKYKMAQNNNKEY
jgi:hypothetical protein